MATLLFSSREDPPELWVPALQKEIPDLEIRVEPEVGDAAEIDYALTYHAPHGLLASLPNLRMIHSISAGVDHLIADPKLPRHLPMVRMVDDFLKEMMSEFEVYAVLHFHRDMPSYRAQQERAEWKRGWPSYTPETAVGLLGLGTIGREVASKLATLGFQVHGWRRRSPRGARRWRLGRRLPRRFRPGAAAAVAPLLEPPQGGRHSAHRRGDRAAVGGG